MSLNNTPNSNRLHIGIFGKTNSGKSSLINAVTNQDVAIVSEQAGTTTDPVYKAMEIEQLGACVFIDTAGFADYTEQGDLRLKRTQKVMDKTDVAIVLFTDPELQIEQQWIAELRANSIPIVAVINKADILGDITPLRQQIEAEFGLSPIAVSSLTRSGISDLFTELKRAIPTDFEVESITAHLTHPQDVVLLVVPQDIQAPKGRLILPQVQTIRDLLDRKCVVIAATTEQYPQALACLKEPPKLIITDSQVFEEVYALKPESSVLTSFSVLFARYKGDLAAFVAGAQAIDSLKPTDRVLIAEACTHKPLDGDIGRVKIPTMLRKKVGQDLQIDIVSGSDFPKDLTPYALVIHCGACMFNRKHVMKRVRSAQEQGVPITNYGITIAKVKQILEKINLD